MQKAIIHLLWYHNIYKYRHISLYHIALTFRGSKFSQIVDFELFAENFLRTAGLREKSAKVTTFSLNKFREWLKIHKIREF